MSLVNVETTGGGMGTIVDERIGGLIAETWRAVGTETCSQILDEHGMVHITFWDQPAAKLFCELADPAKGLADEFPGPIGRTDAKISFPLGSVPNAVAKLKRERTRGEICSIKPFAGR